jgi:hypothetical protein
MSPSTPIEIAPPRSLTRRLTKQILEELRADAGPIILVGERLLTAEAMRLLMRLDRDLREARYQLNQDWFRRIMRVRKMAVSRLRRRWEKINPPPALPLGSLRRRYHANPVCYLYDSRP